MHCLQVPQSAFWVSSGEVYQAVNFKRLPRTRKEERYSGVINRHVSSNSLKWHSEKRCHLTYPVTLTKATTGRKVLFGW